MRNKKRDAYGVPTILRDSLPKRVNGDLCPFRDAIHDLAGREVIRSPGKG